ncbi:MAG TPA: sulfonate/nitrate transporter [Pseudomonas sp.]|uniref:ABC transporter substrate-binding protein n=1 Tax=Stutzerimonas TaxID=2901164 RepID=UPI000C9A4C5D|nr:MULTISPECIES: ABC transporter substrate-binding protein [Stutzerimonas]MBU0812906.1 ABC transporter substrate-binding protein [Gammaproteobacteria bacterium]HAQ86141.1 sulfonate/nitrate transporter [Pseudomonas sp.]MBK3847306.1 PhnD/SsuA/transferrin family substrate-binding protein [Stutzerimonas xanthomarina]MBU0851631.1 ABC transporter substrate-binding protein [Gammaproteobacteria bacterium]MBU1302587.1 ABC transporter substrate-binding protein [Gammaproteobacteria bacterium]|tara:strand:+ start:5566 stop:6546 length:981 start_codon:yes stop_codon:yes gene_type:complete
MFKKTLIASSLLVLFSQAALAADTVRWLNDWLPAGDKAVIYLGVDKGLFADQGIEVEIASARGGSDVVTKLATASADFGSAGLASVLQARAQGPVPVVAVAPIYNKQPDAFFTAEGSGIEAFKDIAGKTVATPTFSASNVVFPLVLEANGIDRDGVKLLKLDPGALAPMLATGKVDATINWVTVAPGFARSMQEAGKQLKVIPWSDYGFDGYGLSLIASERFLKDNPEVAKKFIKAYRQAQDMAIADPAAAAAALKKIVPEVDEQQAVEQFTASVPLMQNEVSEAEGTAQFDAERLETTWQWVARAQNLPSDSLDPKQVIANGFVE